MKQILVAHSQVYHHYTLYAGIREDPTIPHVEVPDLFSQIQKTVDSYRSDLGDGIEAICLALRNSDDILDAFRKNDLLQLVGAERIQRDAIEIERSFKKSFFEGYLALIQDRKCIFGKSEIPKNEDRIVMDVIHEIYRSRGYCPG